MLDTKDILQLGLGAAGWLLAAYQFWRNELNKRPLVDIQTSGFERGATSFGGTLIVRNRGPWDAHVESIAVSCPVGTMMVIPGPPVKQLDGTFGPTSPGRKVTRMLGWRLPAHASGEFPFKSTWFAAEFPAPAGPSFAAAEITVEIALNRCTAASKRLIVRKSIQMTNK